MFEAGYKVKGFQLIEKGMKAVPDLWELWVMKGVYLMKFETDYKNAAVLMAEASLKDGAPKYLAALSVTLALKSGESNLVEELVKSLKGSIKDKKILNEFPRNYMNPHKTRQPILKLDHICFLIKSGFFMRQIQILDDICLGLKEGSALGLIGANGAGKTTTLNICAGLIKPNKGAATFKGKLVEHIDAKQKIGYLAEIQHPFKHLKIEEWFHMLGKLSGLRGSALKKRVNTILAVFELEDLEKKFLHKLSKGQLQRVNFAQTLIHKPDILILDETHERVGCLLETSGFNPFKIFQKEGGSILFSSHVLTDVKDVADEIACIDKGRIQWVVDVDKIERYVGKEMNTINFNKLLS